jgi:hypothetical protein
MTVFTIMTITLMAMYRLNLFNEEPRNRKNSNPRKGIKYILKYSHSEPTLSVPFASCGGDKSTNPEGIT